MAAHERVDDAAGEPGDGETDCDEQADVEGFHEETLYRPVSPSGRQNALIGWQL